MIRETLSAFALVVLIAVPSAMAAPSAGPPPWKIEVPQQNVTLGDPIGFMVYGPLDGTFNVSLKPDFVNQSGNVFFHTYRMPNATAAGNVTNPSIFISIPSRPLTYGGYVLTVTNITLHLGVGQETIYMVQGANTTLLSGELSTVWLLLNITEKRELSLLYQQTLFENQAEEYFWIGIAEFIILCFAIFWTRTGAANSRWGRVLRRTFHDLLWGRADSDPWEGTEAPNPVPQPDVNRTWISKLFPECDTCAHPTGPQEKALHLRQDHGVPNPRKGIDYERQVGSLKLAMSKVVEHQPDPGRLYDAIDEIPKNAFDDIEQSLPAEQRAPMPSRFSFRKANTGN
jgi:hypothetical protein